MKAWFCTILSAFGVIILSVIAHLFDINHEVFTGSINDPEDGPAYVLSFVTFLSSRVIIRTYCLSLDLHFFFTNREMLLFNFTSILAEKWMEEAGLPASLSCIMFPPRILSS